MISSQRWTLVATSFGLGMALLDVTAVNVAVPAIRASLDTDVRGLSWIIDGYSLSFASLLLFAGGLGDRLGSRRIFMAGLALFTFASLLCGAAPTLPLLVAARILQGVGAALFMPSSLAILRLAYPDDRERARAIGIWSGLTAIAGASGPLLGGLVIAALGWRCIFLLNVPLGVVALVMAYRHVPRSGRTAHKGYDIAAQATIAASLALFTWALIERPARGWGSPIIVGAFILSAIGVRAFVVLERRAPSPILPLRLFSDRTFASTVAAALVYVGSFFGSLLVFSLDFQQVKGEAPILAGLHLTVIAASFAATSFFSGRLVARHGTRPPIVVGLTLLIASAWIAASIPTSAPFIALFPALLLMGVGAGLVTPSLNAAILAAVPQSLAGVAAGVLNASRQLGTALVVAVFASLFHGEAQAAAVRTSLLWAGVLYLIALATILMASISVLGSQRPRVETSASSN